MKSEISLDTGMRT